MLSQEDLLADMDAGDISQPVRGLRFSDQDDCRVAMDNTRTLRDVRVCPECCEPVADDINWQPATARCAWCDDALRHNELVEAKESARRNRKSAIAAQRHYLTCAILYSSVSLIVGIVVGWVIAVA